MGIKILKTAQKREQQVDCSHESKELRLLEEERHSCWEENYKSEENCKNQKENQKESRVS